MGLPHCFPILRWHCLKMGQAFELEWACERVLPTNKLCMHSHCFMAFCFLCRWSCAIGWHPGSSPCMREHSDNRKLRSQLLLATRVGCALIRLFHQYCSEIVQDRNSQHFMTTPLQVRLMMSLDWNK